MYFLILILLILILEDQSLISFKIYEQKNTDHPIVNNCQLKLFTITVSAIALHHNFRFFLSIRYDQSLSKYQIASMLVCCSSMASYLKLTTAILKSRLMSLLRAYRRTSTIILMTLFWTLTVKSSYIIQERLTFYIFPQIYPE